MSAGVAGDVLQQVLNWIRSGSVVGPHTHSSTNGGPIISDLPLTVTNPLQPAIISRTQVINQNFNADLWRGHRYYTGLIAPAPSTSILNLGDFWFNGTNLYEWTGSKWVTGGGLSAVNFYVNSSLIAAQLGINLIQGANITITGVNNSAANRVDVTLSATSAGGLSNVAYAVLTSSYNTTATSPGVAVGLGVSVIAPPSGSVLLLSTLRITNNTSSDGISASWYRSTVGIPSQGSAPNANDNIIRSSGNYVPSANFYFDAIAILRDTGLNPGQTYYYYVTIYITTGGTGTINGAYNNSEITVIPCA